MRHRRLLPPGYVGRERGQTSAEYAGIIVVAVTLVLALVLSATLWGGDLVKGITCKIGELFGIGCSTDSMAPDPADVVVDEKQDSYSSSHDVGVSVGVAEVGAGVAGGDGITTQRHGDGSGRVTVNSSGSANVHASVGRSFSKGGTSAELEAALTAEGTYTTSYSVNCASKQECDALEQDVRENSGDRASEAESWGRNHATAKNGDQYSETWSGEVAITGSAQAGNKGSGVDVNVAADVKGSARASSTTNYTVDEDGRKGDKTGTSLSIDYTLSGGASGEASASADLIKTEIGSIEGNASVSAQIQGDIGENYQVNRDANGNLTEVTFTTTSSWQVDGQASASADAKAGGATVEGPSVDASGHHGRQYVTTVTVDVTQLSPEDRAAMEQYVSSMSSADPFFPSSVYNPSKPVSEKGTAADVIQRNAQVSTAVYDYQSSSESDKDDYIIYSHEESATHSNKHLLGHRYLTAPGADGSRSYVQTPESSTSGGN